MYVCIYKNMYVYIYIYIYMYIYMYMHSRRYFREKISKVDKSTQIKNSIDVWYWIDEYWLQADHGPICFVAPADVGNGAEHTGVFLCYVVYIICVYVYIHKHARSHIAGFVRNVEIFSLCMHSYICIYMYIYVYTYINMHTRVRRTY